MINLLSAFSSDPDQKYVTAGTHQRFIQAPGVCLAYQPHRNFSAYNSNSGRISVIANRDEAIKSLIPEIFHSPHSLDPTSPLHISPFNIVANMPRSGQDKLPAFLQCVRHSKLGKIFGLTLPDLNPHTSNFYNLTSHYLYAKLIELGSEDLATRVLTAVSISEVSQHDFDMNNLTVTPKHVKLLKIYKGSCGIEDLEKIYNPFNIVNIMDLPKIIEIGSIASRQSIAKNRKSVLSSNPKFSSKEQQPTSSGASSEQSEDEATIKLSLKLQLKPVKDSNSPAMRTSSF